MWLGTTVENQEEADRRIPHLQAVPAVVRFLSCEPLIEAIEPDLRGISWVICGGESGGGCRPIDPSWVRDLRDRCAASSVAFFFKQWSGLRPAMLGREVDGREWSEFPKLAAHLASESA